MANNRQPDLIPNQSPSSSSSSEEEEEDATGSEDEQSSGSESDEISDSDSEQKPKTTLISPPQSAIKPKDQNQSSSETEDSGSDTDSDSPVKKSTIVDPNIKPISSKPMETLESKLVKKSGTKTSLTPPPAKSKRPPPPSPVIEKDAKKAKSSTTNTTNTTSTTNTATDDDSKKQLFQRLWSEDDEIVILKGMIDYKTEKNGENPVADMGAFHEFIKKSLHVDVSRAQLVDKVRRLKKKYVNNASREKNGKDRSFSKSHEQKGYELSKLIWSSGSSSNSGTESKKIVTQKNGNGKGNAASTSTGTGVTLVKSNGVDGDKEVSKMEVEKNMDISRFVQFDGKNDTSVLTEEIMKAGMELAEGSKRVELEETWKKLKVQELELFVKRMDLIKEQALIVLEAVNSSGI